MSKEIKIRSATEADADSLSTLIAERGFDYPTEKPLVHERFTELIQAGDCILVAEDDSENIIGMALLHRTYFLHRQPDGRISSLVVSEEHRGHGVGVKLIQAAEAIFRNWGCGRIEVSSGAKREKAHKFYLREGFSEQPKRFIKLINKIP